MEQRAISADRWARDHFSGGFGLLPVILAAIVPKCPLCILMYLGLAGSLTWLAAGLSVVLKFLPVGAFSFAFAILLWRRRFAFLYRFAISFTLVCLLAAGIVDLCPPSVIWLGATICWGVCYWKSGIQNDVRIGVGNQLHSCCEECIPVASHGKS